MIAALALGWPLLTEFLETGLVPRLPTAILATGLMILAFMSFITGLILDTVTLGRRELKRLHYLSLQGPTFGERRRARDSLTPAVTAAYAPNTADTVGAMKSFAIVGGAGFVIEGVILTALIAARRLETRGSRASLLRDWRCSSTWLLNRTHTFAGRGPERRSDGSIALRRDPGCAAPASTWRFLRSAAWRGRARPRFRWCRWRSAQLEGFGVQLRGVERLAVRNAAERSPADDPEQLEQAYSGVDNLEVMSEAENYNRYLLGLVRRHARTTSARPRLRCGQRSVRIAAGAIWDLTSPHWSRTSCLRKTAGRGVAAAAGPEQLPDDAVRVHLYAQRAGAHPGRRRGAAAAAHETDSRRNAARLCARFPRALHQHGCESRSPAALHARDADNRRPCSRLHGRELRLRGLARLLCGAALQSSSTAAPATSIVRALRLYDRAIFPLSRLVDSVTGRWFGKNLLLIAH